jgi:hypothetical protein
LGASRTKLPRLHDEADTLPVLVETVELRDVQDEVFSLLAPLADEHG